MSASCQRDCDLQSLHTLQLRSRASWFAKLSDPAELGGLRRFAQQHRLPILPLGQGSNVIPRALVDALVVQVALQGRRVLAENNDTVLLEVAAGEDWQELVSLCVDQGWHGLENLALIPGVVGGAPIQNIGAYGVEIASCIDKVKLLPLDEKALADYADAKGWQRDASGTYLLSAAQCAFGYRDSIFKRELKHLCVIVAVVFRLRKRYLPVLDYPALAVYINAVKANQARHKNTTTADDAKPTAREVFDAVVEIRRSKLPDPVTIPNAGSFFKNPLVNAGEAGALAARFPALPIYQVEGKPAQKKLAAGWMIEYCGFKGNNTGDKSPACERAQVRETLLGMHAQQALVLVNHRPGVTSADDVLAFARRVSSAVELEFGVALEIEPQILG
ncbi:MAG: UDP-N-acetylmuramate dehydrogenase [Pseudomonadales bacterium]